MFLLRRLTPAIVTIVTAACFLAFSYRPHLFVSLTGGSTGTLAGITLGLALFALSLGMLNIGAYHPLTSRLRFLLFPLTFASCTFQSLSFVEPGWAVLGGITIVSALLWIWYETLYTFWQQPERYQAYTLQRLSASLYVVAVFFLIAGMNGFYVYLQMKFWGVVAFVSLTIFCLLYDMFLLCQFTQNESLVSAIATSFLATEAFIAMSYLPTQVYVEALLMAVVFYGLVGITKLWSQEDFRRSQWLPYVIVSSACFLLTLSSSLWIF